MHFVNFVSPGTVAVVLTLFLLAPLRNGVPGTFPRLLHIFVALFLRDRAV
jgi:hypothetical protein